jgi:integrase
VDTGLRGVRARWRVAGVAAPGAKRQGAACPERREPTAVTLPWETLDGELRTARLFLATPDGDPMLRNAFNNRIWRPAIRAAGIEADRRNGMHMLRHTYASVLFDAGESIKALSLYPGHADPGVHLAYVHASAADQRGPHPTCDR